MQASKPKLKQINLGSLVALILIGAGVTSYKMFFNNDVGVAYIKANSQPIKVRPKERGGKVVAGSDNMIYDSLKKDKKSESNIKFAPKAEKPIKIIYSIAAANNDSFANSIDEILANLDEFEAEANKLDTKEIDGFVLPAARGREQEQAETINSSYNITTAPEQLHKLTKFSPKINPNQGYSIQLAIAISGPAATEKWRLIKQKHPKILKNTELKLRQITDKKKRIYFLVTAGTFDSAIEASKACRQLKSRRQKCLVLK